MEQQDNATNRLGIAISGGGHRATAWGTGAILGVVEAGLAANVECISSVSGGSIVNGVVANAGDLRREPAAIVPALATMTETIVNDGLFWFGAKTNGWVARFLFMVAVAVGALVAMVASFMVVARDVTVAWFALVPAITLVAWVVVRPRLAKMRMPLQPQIALLAGLLVGGALALPMTWITSRAHGWFVALLACAAVAAITIIVFLLWLRVFAARSLVVDHAIAQTFLKPEPPLLAERDRTVHHVFCVTDLLSGDQLYFTPRLVTGYRHGFGTPGQLPLSTAMQCSACLPGAFPPRVLDNKGNNAFNFKRTYDLNRPGFPKGGHVDELFVNDGGVYDNMADQWQQGFHDRRARDGWPQHDEEPVDILIVANAGGSLSFRKEVPGKLWRDIPGLKRTIDILYDVSTSHRRQRLVESFDLAGSGAGLGGVLTHVRTSPVSVARRFQHRGTDKQKADGAAAEKILLELQSEQDWFAIGDRNAGVKTTLGCLDRDQVVDLVWHAFVLTRVGLWVGHGLAPATIDDLRRSRVVELLTPPA